jgi:hypothetical protein
VGAVEIENGIDLRVLIDGMEAVAVVGVDTNIMVT